jgi:hypothetical protein
MGIHIDFTSPATLQKLADLPHFGMAEALVRRIDPWWHAPEPPYKFRVEIVSVEESECPTCGCDCCYESEVSDVIEVVAANEDEALDLAAAECPSAWSVQGILPPKFPTATVPPEFLSWFSTSQETDHAE